MINFIQINDWEIKKFIKIILAIQFGIWGAIGLDAIGLHIPILRQIIGFIYLSFIPGILILRIFKLHKLGNIETLLYGVGLSLTTLMFTGFFMNMIYPLFSISGPISPLPLIITISAVVLVLCVLSYVTDKDFVDPGFIDLGEVLSPPVLFLCLIPFMAVLGTYLVNFHHNNILLMLMIAIIAFIALLIGFNKFIPVKLYPLAIWVMAISLIWHNTLISSYINVCDVVSEYYAADLVVKNSFWDWTIYGGFNSVLSTVMLAPIFHHICNLDLTWIFKIIYPLLFSLVSVGAYSIFVKVTKNDKIAFLSSFLLVSVAPFFVVVTLITKQSTAEIFWVLLLMLILSRNMNAMKKSILMIVFGAALIVSHYGTSYLVMGSFIFVWLFLFFTENQTAKGLCRRFYFTFRKREWITDNLNTKNKNISFNFVLLYFVFAVMWYMYVSNSSIFDNIVHMGEYAVNSVNTEFLNPEYSRGLYLITKELVSPLHTIYRYFYLTIQFFIVIGLTKILLNYEKIKFETMYLGFAIYFFILLLAAIVHTGISAMDPRRLYHLTLFIIAPFSIFGGLVICETIYIIFKIPWTTSRLYHSLTILSVVLAIFFLFNTGFMYEVAKDHPGSISISQESIKKYGDIIDKAGFYGGYIMTQDVYSGRWLGAYMKSDEQIYSNEIVIDYPSLTIYGYIDEKNIKRFDNKTKEIKDDYTILGYANVIEGVGSIWYNPLQKRIVFEMSDVFHLFVNKSKIYSNGGSEIYK